ncbi:MAG: RNA methyltransferase, partial [Actinomycetota bacterium]|nr:RNA methyltransferase [Actinomycetota bacterium]
MDDPADPRVSDFFRLNDRELRRDGYFVAEGVLVIRQLLQSPYPVRAVLGTPTALAALDDDLAGVAAPVYVITQSLMTSIAGFHFHRGALASAGRRPHPDPASVASGADLLLVAEGVADNENLGGLFRNAAAFGVGGVILDASSADPLYRRTVRVSMGQVLRLPHTRVARAPEALTALQELGFEVLALTPAVGADEVGSVAPRPRQALVVGAEGPGLSPAALRAAGRR